MTEPEIQSRQDVLFVLGRAVEDAFDEDILNVLYDIDEGALPIEQFEIDEVSSDYNDGNQTAASGRIDRLLTELGIDPKDWGKALINGEKTVGLHDEAVTIHDARLAKRRGESLGTFLTECSFDALPIEWEDAGEGYVSISLARGSEHVVRLYSQGSFWTERSDDEEDDGSDVGYTIRYLADISLRDLAKED